MPVSVPCRHSPPAAPESFPGLTLEHFFTAERPAQNG